MRRRVRRTKEARREEILRAATDAFAERGYAAARMHDIAQRAEVADGTLYLYFKGKEHLLVTLLEERARAFLMRARRDAAAASDPGEKLRRVIHRHLLSLERDRALACVFQIELRHSRRFLRRIAHGVVADYLQLVQGIVAEGVEGGRLRPDVAPDVAARVVFGAADELVTAWVLARRPGRLADASSQLVRVLLEGLRARACGGEP
jgi:TetR/AcrR family fatty acid metabolism transcriptional regulator